MQALCSSETNEISSLGCNELEAIHIFICRLRAHFQDDPSVVDYGTSQWGSYNSITSLSCTIVDPIHPLADHRVPITFST